MHALRQTLSAKDAEEAFDHLDCQQKRRFILPQLMQSFALRGRLMLSRKNGLAFFTLLHSSVPQSVLPDRLWWDLHGVPYMVGIQPRPTLEVSILA